MSEKPTWLKGVVEGGKEMSLHEEQQLMELTAVKAFLDDSAPENWEAEIDHEELNEYRNEILKWDNKKLISFCQNTYIWDDPTYAKALLDVIKGKITPVLKDDHAA